MPLTPEADALRRSISGGPDGLKWAEAIIGHARTLGTDVGFTFGSYSSPRRAMELLEHAGYRVAAVTLCPLPLGDFTREHPERMAELEQRGEAVVWHHGPEAPGYFIVGLACRRTAPEPVNGHGPLTGEGLMELLRAAATSRSTRLEALNGRAPSPLPWSGPLRVFDPPPPPRGTTGDRAPGPVTSSAGYRGEPAVRQEAGPGRRGGEGRAQRVVDAVVDDEEVGAPEG